MVLDITIKLTTTTPRVSFSPYYLNIRKTSFHGNNLIKHFKENDKGEIVAKFEDFNVHDDDELRIVLIIQGLEGNECKGSISASTKNDKKEYISQLDEEKFNSDGSIAFVKTIEINKNK